jgi:hypothetical protein
MQSVLILLLLVTVFFPACAAAAPEPDPADLVREIRATESWIDRAKSVRRVIVFSCAAMAPRCGTQTKKVWGRAFSATGR